jgi:hypothetical protein
MGIYLNYDSNGNELPTIGKAEALIKDGAKKIYEPEKFQKNLVCVVENGLFDAAAYAYSEEEFNYFRKIQKNGSDTRPYTWLICSDEQINNAS